jgi:hypothetical protein
MECLTGRDRKTTDKIDSERAGNTEQRSKVIRCGPSIVSGTSCWPTCDSLRNSHRFMEIRESSPDKGGAPSKLCLGGICLSHHRHSWCETTDPPNGCPVQALLGRDCLSHHRHSRGYPKTIPETKRLETARVVLSRPSRRSQPSNPTPARSHGHRPFAHHFCLSGHTPK